MPAPLTAQPTSFCNTRQCTRTILHDAQKLGAELSIPVRMDHQPGKLWGVALLRNSQLVLELPLPAGARVPADIAPETPIELRFQRYGADCRFACTVRRAQVLPDGEGTLLVIHCAGQRCLTCQDPLR